MRLNGFPEVLYLLTNIIFWKSKIILTKIDIPYVKS